MTGPVQLVLGKQLNNKSLNDYLSVVNRINIEKNSDQRLQTNRRAD